MTSRQLQAYDRAVLRTFEHQAMLAISRMRFSPAYRWNGKKWVRQRKRKG